LIGTAISSGREFSLDRLPYPAPRRWPLAQFVDKFMTVN